jgi:FkbM family methyltransferase
MRDFLRRLLWSLDLDVKRRISLSTLEANLMQVLKGKSTAILCDVGANVGQFAVMTRRLGYSGRIFSFEPNSEAFQKLALVSEKDREWECFQLALSDCKESRTLHNYNYSVLSSFSELNIEGQKKFPGAKEVTTETVKVDRLDTFLNSRVDAEGPIFIKTDTQGFDLKVFLGAEGVYKRVVGICCELSVRNLYKEETDWRTAISAYENAGFSLSGIYPVSRNENLNLLEVNAIFVRSDAKENAD